MKSPPKLTFNCEEKEIENALVWDCKHFLQLKFLKNQVRLPVGIIDILATNPEYKGVYYVIEVKRDTLNASAYSQCMRYVHYLNINHSKGGKRLFLPLLIGKNLSTELHGMAKHYSPGEHHDHNDIGYCLYTLFEFDAKNGLSFAYRNTAQIEYYDAHLIPNDISYFDRLCEHIEAMSFIYLQEANILRNQVEALEGKLSSGDYYA